MCLSVRGRTPTVLHGPGCNLGAWYSCAPLGGFAIGARVALLWQHNANPSNKLASITRYDDIVRTAGWAGSARAAGRSLADDGGRSQNCAPYMGSGRGWLAGDWPSTRGVLNITAAAWTSGFHWWRSATTRTQNVSEYMLVTRSMPNLI